MNRLTLVTVLCCLSPVANAADPVEDSGWIRIKLDERFRSEGSAAADLNNDGAVDVIAGDVWYQAPAHNSGDYTDPSQWQMHEIREPGEFVAGTGYSNSFANTAHDVDGDGWTDVVIIGFPGAPFHWYQNPGSDGGDWKEHQIWTSACNESPEFEDLNGDGSPEVIVGSQPEGRLGFTRFDVATRDPQHAFHPVGEKSKGNGGDNGSHMFYHGLGVGDVNGDGHDDILIRQGWHESPGDLSTRELWTFHPFRITNEGLDSEIPHCANIYANDLDLDGDADLICSSAHKYGVWWFENQGDNQFEQHLIDKSYSQTHALEEVDINGDGQLDYVTGKRFFAHNGHDPGGNDPVVMYWYEVKRTKGQAPQFTPHEIVAGRDTGIGTQFTIQDMNADGRPDIVLSNKKGVNVLLQK